MQLLGVTIHIGVTHSVTSHNKLKLKFSGMFLEYGRYPIWKKCTFIHICSGNSHTPIVTVGRRVYESTKVGLMAPLSYVWESSTIKARNIGKIK